MEDINDISKRLNNDTIKKLDREIELLRLFKEGMPPGRSSVYFKKPEIRTKVVEWVVRKITIEELISFLKEGLDDGR